MYFKNRFILRHTSIRSDHNIFFFLQTVVGVLHPERRGEGLHLFSERGQRHALVFRLAAHARSRFADMQRDRKHGAGQRVLC